MLCGSSSGLATMPDSDGKERSVILDSGMVANDRPRIATKDVSPVPTAALLGAVASSMRLALHAIRLQLQHLLFHRRIT